MIEIMIIPILIFIFVIVVFVVIITFTSRKKNKIIEVLERQSMKRNGFIQKNFLFYPRLEFQHHTFNVKVNMHPGSKNSPPYTRVDVLLDVPISFKMRVYNETFASKIGKKFGTQDIQIGIEDFDNKFMIKASDEYITTKILDFNIQNKLIELSRYHPTVEISGNKIIIDVRFLFDDDHEYDLLIDTALNLVDKMRENSLI